MLPCFWLLLPRGDGRGRVACRLSGSLGLFGATTRHCVAHAPTSHAVWEITKPYISRCLGNYETLHLTLFGELRNPTSHAVLRIHRYLVGGDHRAVGQCRQLLFTIVLCRQLLFTIIYCFSSLGSPSYLCRFCSHQMSATSVRHSYWYKS